MKSVKTIAYLFIAAITFCSCVKDIDGDADQYVGVYKVSVAQNTRWGNATATLTDNGTITITKLSSNQIKITGFITTKGRVSGNTVYLESTTNSDAAGSITTVYDAGFYNAGVLTINATLTGHLIDGGISYPFSSRDKITAIKQ